MSAAAPARPTSSPASSVDEPVERRTLLRLPFGSDILFTPGTYLEPLERLSSHPDRSRLATSFAGQISTLDEARLDHKGLTADRDRLAWVLRTAATSDHGLGIFFIVRPICG